MVLHITEDIVVNIAEEVHFWLNPPVVLYVGESRVFIEETTVPSTHLVVRKHARVLDVVLLEDLDGFGE